ETTNGALHILSLHAALPICLTGAFRPVDFRHPPARDSASAQRNIDGQRSGGDGGDLQMGGVAQANDRPVAKPFCQICQRRLQRLVTALIVCHASLPLALPGGNILLITRLSLLCSARLCHTSCAGFMFSNAVFYGESPSLRPERSHPTRHRALIALRGVWYNACA